MFMFLVLLVATVVESSHFRYGTLTWSRVPDEPNSAQITLTLGWRRSYFGSPDVGDSAPDRSASLFRLGDGTTMRNPAITVTALSLEDDWIMGSLSVTHDYGAPVDGNGDPWVASFTGCCRLNSLQFWPGGDWNLGTLVDLRGNNSAPVSQQLPIVTIPKDGLVHTWTIGAADNDAGDVLSFQMPSVTSGEGPVGHSIDPLTGTVSLNTAAVANLGMYPNRIVIADSQGLFITVDYLVDVVEPIRVCTGCPLAEQQCGQTCGQDNECPCSNTAGACQVNVPPVLTIVMPDAPQLGSQTFCFAQGEQSEFTISAFDPDAEEDITGCGGLTVQEGALPAGSQCLGSGTAERVFRWTPNPYDQGSHIICFEAIDAAGAKSEAVCSTVLVPDPVTATRPLLFGVGPAIQDAAGGDVLLVRLFGQLFSGQYGVECTVDGIGVPGTVLSDVEVECRIPSSVPARGNGERIGVRKLPCGTEAVDTYKIPGSYYDEIWADNGAQVACPSGTVFEGQSCASVVDWATCADRAWTPESLVTRNMLELDAGSIAQFGSLTLNLFHGLTNLRTVTAIVLNDRPDEEDCTYPASGHWTKGVRNGGSSDDGICRDLYQSEIPWAVATGRCGMMRSESATHVLQDGFADVYFTETLPDQRGLPVTRQVRNRLYFQVKFPRTVAASNTMIQFADPRLLAAVTEQRWNVADQAVDLDLTVQLQPPFKITSLQLESSELPAGIEVELADELVQDCVDESGQFSCTQRYAAVLRPVGGTCRINGLYRFYASISCQDGVAVADCPIDPANPGPPALIEAVLMSEDFCALTETSIGAVGTLSVHRAFDPLNNVFGQPHSSFMQNEPMQFRLKVKSTRGFNLISSEIVEVRVARSTAEANTTSLLIFARTGPVNDPDWGWQTELLVGGAREEHVHQFQFAATPSVYGDVATDGNEQASVTATVALIFEGDQGSRKRRIVQLQALTAGPSMRGEFESGPVILDTSVRFELLGLMDNEPGLTGPILSTVSPKEPALWPWDPEDEFTTVLMSGLGTLFLTCCLLVFFVIVVRKRRSKKGYTTDSV